LRAAVGALLVVTTSPALADEATKACSASFEKAQYLRKDSKLVSAREQAMVCARPTCPSFVRDECTRILSEIDAAQPTVVFAARDAKGVDLVDVGVEVDGRPLATRLDGSAIPLDPGEHTVRFSRSPEPAIEQHVVIRAGEKNRAVSVQFVSQPSPQPFALDSAAPPPEPRTVKVRGPIWPAIVVGTVGVAAIATSIGFGVDAKNTADNLRNTCAPRCAYGDVNALNTELVVSDVLLVAGIVTVGLATVLLIARPGGHEAAIPTAFSIGPTHDGVAASLRLAF